MYDYDSARPGEAFNAVYDDKPLPASWPWPERVPGPWLGGRAKEG